MDLSKVNTALERILARLSESYSTNANVGKRMREQVDLSELTPLFREIPDLSEFDGQLQIVSGQVSRVTYETLSQWLVERATESRIDEALSDLAKFIEAKKIPFQRLSAVEGLGLQRPCEVQPGVRLLPWTDVRQTKSVRRIDDFWRRQFRFSTASVVREVNETKILFLLQIANQILYDRGELGFRLRVRGARYLGHSITKGRTLSKELRSLYRARSVAVHTGILPETIDGILVKNLLERG